MLSPISPSGQQFVDSINKIQARLTAAQQQLSTGLKVSQPSDAPDEISPILQLHSAIQQNKDIQTGLNSAVTSMKAGESALSDAVNLLQSAAVAATQGTGIDQTADTRATLAKTVQTLLEQMVSDSRTTVGQSYVFSGDNDSAPSYQLNLSATDGVDRLQVADSTRLTQGFGGTSYSTSLSGNVVFDHRNSDDTPASDNAFAALNKLRVALLNNNTADITSAAADINTASTYMNSQLAFYGQAQNRVSADLTRAQSDSLQLQTQLSDKTDADETQAITELTEGATQLQAALSARAKIPNTSLFDVLPISG